MKLENFMNFTNFMKLVHDNFRDFRTLVRKGPYLSIFVRISPQFFPYFHLPSRASGEQSSPPQPCMAKRTPRKKRWSARTVFITTKQRAKLEPVKAVLKQCCAFGICSLQYADRHRFTIFVTLFSDHFPLNEQLKKKLRSDLTKSY